MSPGAKLVFEAWPYVLALVVGMLIPSRKSWYERISIGIVAALSVAMISGLWPGKEAALAADTPPAPPNEWQNLLNVIVFLPIFGSIAVLFLPRQSPALLRRFTMLVLGLDLLASLWLLKVPMTQGWHFQYVTDWLPSFGIRYHVAVDGVSLWLILLSTLTTPIAAYVSFGSIKGRTKDLCFALLLLHGGMLGAFVSLDLFLFYVFWELMLIPMVILIGIWGGVEKIKAAYKFFLYTMAGSVLMLAAILYMVWAHAKLAGFVSFDYLALKNLVLPKTAASLCFFAFFIAFAVKVPMFPLHTWLPDAHVQAPTGGSIILAAVLLKLGTYGYVRFCMGMFAGPAWQSAANLAGLAIGGGILYAALVAWKQDDVKRLVAYSSVAHMGFVMLGLFSGTRSGIEGALLQMINHGISTGALFLLVGVIYDRRHTREVREFGGLAKVMPIYAAIFIIVTMSSIGVPGTNGFVGELMIVLGTFVSLPLGSHGQIQATLAMTGVILAAVYMLSVVQKMFFGPLANPKNKNLPDLNVRETVALAPLVALIFVIGLFPGIILDRMKDGVSTVLDNYTSGKKAYDELGPEATQPVLRPRKGGPLETGYPEPPKPEGASEEAPPDETKTAELGVQPPTMPPPGGEVPAPAPRPVQPGHEGHGHP
jgi:NADH-quinone oxidoreductase subunit M